MTAIGTFHQNHQSLCLKSAGLLPGCRLGRALAEANDFRMLQGELLARLGEVESDRSQKMEYLQRSLSVFRELGAVDRMREVQTSVHIAVMGH